MELDKKLYPSRSKPARDPKETLKLIGSDIDIFRKVNDLIRKGEHYETAIYTIAGNPKSFETVKKIYNTYTWWAHRFAGKLTSAPFRAFRGRPPNDPRRRFVQALLRDAYSPKRKTGALIAKEWESFYSYLNVCLEILKSHLY
ncbi:MAG: hypothetical protein Q6354_03915 [Candidatus Brocadiales bacterium]|nr:hypothetical protein [Candidatus Brocadiales bacterium]